MIINETAMIKRNAPRKISPASPRVELVAASKSMINVLQGARFKMCEGTQRAIEMVARRRI